MRRGARFLLCAGTLGVVFGLAKYHAAEIGHYSLHGTPRLAWSIVYIGLLCVAAYGAGLPDLASGLKSALAASVGSTGVAAIGISLAQLGLGSQLLPRFVVLGAPLVLVPWYVVCTAVATGGRARGADRDRVVLVGGPEETATLRDELERSSERPAAVVAELRPEEAGSEDWRRKPVVETVVQQRGTVIVLDRLAQADESIVAQAATLHESGLRVRTLTLFYDEWLGKLPLSELERVSLMFDIGELHRARYGRVKRLVDLVLAIIGLPVLIVALPFVVIGDLVANRGPILYRQPRVGRNGQTFEIVKFRTMGPLDGELANEWTTEDDPRITPFGRFMRRVHLDELPQVLNVLRGDLSLVGPRPEQPHYVAELVEKIPFYNLRHLVRPGVTGWAQVKYGYAGSETDALEKLQYEFYYLRHQGLTLDARIMGRTLRHVASGRGR